MDIERKLSLAYACGLAFLGLHFAFSNFGAALLPGLLACALLAVIVLACAGSGRVALGLFGRWELSNPERTLIGCTLGLGMLSTGMFLLGCAGLMRTWAVGALLSVLWVVGFTELREAVDSLRADRNLLRDRPLWTGGLAVLLGATFWASWVPPHQYDALVYHLPLAAAYLRSGRIAPVDHLLYAHFPQNGEMLFALALSLGSDLLAQLFSWLGLALSVLWVFENGKREMPMNAVLLACVLVASHPAVMLLSSIAYVETLVMLWVTASVLCFSRWRETAGTEDGAAGWLALSAVFSGLGLGTKYTAGICPASIVLLLLWRRSRPRDLALFCGLAAAAAAPWLLKNLYYVGNPVFPFLYDSIAHHGVAWGPENARRYFKFLTEYSHPAGHFLRDLIEFPYLAASGNLRFGRGADVLGGLGWGGLLGLVPAAFWAARRNRTFRWLLAYCALHWAAWFSTGVVLRFLTALVPVLCLPAAAGFFQVWSSLEGRWRTALGCALAVFIAMNLGLFLYVHAVFRSGDVLLGLEDRKEFLSRKLDYYPCARWAADNLAKNDRILVVGDQRGYYVEQEQVTTTPMAPNAFVEWANQAADAGGLAGSLRREGRFTHLLSVPREARRLDGYGVFSFTGRGARNWSGLESGILKKLFSTPACALFELPR